MITLGIIPARYASTRFPGKPLADIGGKTMVQRVYEQVEQCTALQQVVVATDDERIAEHVHSFGGQVVMTRPDHPTGTDRCAEAAAHFPDADWVVNIQGDEPFIRPEQIELLCHTLQSSKGIATLAKKITDPAQLANPNIVKVVVNQLGQALYFSRHSIPFVRDVELENWAAQGLHHKHIGLYGFSKTVLDELTRLSPTPLEQAESLEQLRWLDHGYSIAVGITAWETLGIDTPEDLERAMGAL